METDTNTMNELEKETAPVQEPQADLETTATFTQPVEGPVMESIPQPEPPVGGKVKKGFLRACGSWTDIIPIAAMLSVIMILFGDLVSTLLDRNVIPAREIAMRLLGDEGSVEFLLQYFEFFGIWLVFMLIILVFRDNRPMWKAYLYNGHGNNLKAIPAGIALGFGMNGFCILMSCIMGDIKLSFNRFQPLVFFAFLLCVMIQSGAEEIVDRCYLYQKLRRRYRWPAIAVIVNALVFMALHMGNPGVTMLGLLQVFLIGVLFSLIVYYWDSLWTVIWAHTAWNFSQSIVFGLPNSGIVSSYSVFKLEAASARDGIFYNTSFGVEGSLGANVLIGIAIVVVLIYGLVTKRGERVDLWEEMENRDEGRKHIWEAVVLTIIMVAVLAAGIFAARWINEHADEIQQITEELEQVQAEEQNSEGQITDEQTEQNPDGQSTEQPVAQPAEQPATVEPEAESPAVETPAVEQPATVEPGNPAAETPAAEEPGAAQPASEAPAVEQPVIEGQGGL
jgi:membrane protease YdiL (CAAX protease family)